MYGFLITVIICATVIILAVVGFNCYRCKYRCKLKIERLRMRKMSQKDPDIEYPGYICSNAKLSSHESEEPYQGTFKGFYRDADGNMIPVEPSKKPGRN